MPLTVPTADMNELLQRSGSNDENIARAASREIAVAFTKIVKEGVMDGDNLGGIYTPVPLGSGATAEFQLDFLTPGTESSFIAFTIPNTGAVPYKQVEGNFIIVPTFDVGAAIDYPLKLAQNSRFDQVGRALEVLEGMFIRKANSDGWHVILAAAVNRNLTLYDDQVTAGLFSKRLVSLLRIALKRNAGGNATSAKQGKLTDIALSVEALEDVRSWDLTQVDDITRREIFISEEYTRVAGVNLRGMNEFGAGQEYEKYLLTTLAATLPGSKIEFCVGLDLKSKDSFVWPIRQPLDIREDFALHRQRRQGWYGWWEYGVGLLDNRRVILGAI